MKLFYRDYQKLLPQPVKFSQPIKGIVQEVITGNKPGRVKCQASYWPAKLCESQQGVKLEKNQSVTVVGREGITLLVAVV